jgi:hypothetical protein
MNRTDETAFLLYASWAGLLLGPAIAAAAAYYLVRKRPKAVTSTIAVSVVLVGFVALGWLSAVSFRDIRLACLSWVMAYVAYCLVGFCVVQVRRFRLFGGALILPVLASYLLGTVGAVGLAMILGEIVPRTQGQLDSMHRFAILTSGNATTETGGTVVEIYREVSRLPFFEHRIFRAQYDNEQYDTASIGVTTERDSSGRVRAVVRSKFRPLASMLLE